MDLLNHHLLSDILSSTDRFYTQLAPLLAKSIPFAEEILPVLVHTLLQEGVGNATGVSTKKKNQTTSHLSYKPTV